MLFCATMNGNCASEQELGEFKKRKGTQGDHVYSK